MTAASCPEMGLCLCAVHAEHAVVRMRFQVAVDRGVETDQPEKIVVRNLSETHPSDVIVKSVPFPFHRSEDINAVPPGRKCPDQSGRVFLTSAERRIIAFYDRYFHF